MQTNTYCYKLQINGLFKHILTLTLEYVWEFGEEGRTLEGVFVDNSFKKIESVFVENDKLILISNVFLF